VTRKQPGGAGGEDLRSAARSDASGGAAAAGANGPRRAALWRALDKLRGMGWALGDQCLVSAANFLTIYLFARHLDTSHFGAFMLAYVGLQLLTSMQSAFLTQPHNVLAAALPPLEYRRFTGAVLLMQVCACAAVGAALGLVGWLVWRAWSPAAGSVLIALAVAAIPWLAQEFVRRVLYTRGESRAAAKNDFVAYGLQLSGAFLLAGLWADHASPETALAVLGGSSLAGAAVGWWQLRDHVSLGEGMAAALGRTWHEVWHFGKWLTGQNTLVWLGGQGDTWIIGLLLGPEQVGLYRAATHLANVMNIVRQAAISYLPSQSSRAYHHGGAAALSQWVRKAWWWLLGALAPFAIVLVAFPDSVLELAYGNRYATSELALILALSTIAQCVLFAKYPFDIGLLAMRQTKVIFYIHLIPVAFLFTSGVALIYFVGILGVPLSGIVIGTVMLIVTWRTYSRLMGEHAAARPGKGS
jgi:O-antigen/teichoic acid export membrane protein